MNTMQIHSYRTFYKAAKAAVQARRDEYDAEVNEWYESGDGAAPDWQRAGDQPWFDPEWDDAERMINMGGRNYRYPVCIHGTDLTTDYDNICGGCEASLTVAQEAVGLARTWYRRWQWVMSAPSDLPSQYKTDLVVWMMESNRF